MSPYEPWIETLFVVVSTVVGVCVGRWLSRRPSPWWGFGVIVPLPVVLLVGASRRFPALRIDRSFEWLLAGRLQFISVGLASTLLRREEGVVVAVVALSFLIDHYVVVFEITDDAVIVGDPIGGKKRLTIAEFEARWRGVVVVVRRRS